MLQDWMEPERWRARGSSFGPAANVYDRVRPTYPTGAVGWALQPLGRGPVRVLDLGAGTGILTRQLVALGHNVLAVEPDDQMRNRLADMTPGVRALAGRAEEIPLEDASVDAAVAGQAYHWFDRRRAHTELGRVIRPGGVFAAIWNHRDESVAWIAEYSRIVEGDRAPDGAGADSSRPKTMEYGASFAPVELARFHHVIRHTPDSLVELLRSRSYYLTATPARQAALEAEVRGLAASHPDLAGRDRFALAYVTSVYRATRLLIPTGTSATSTGPAAGS